MYSHHLACFFQNKICQKIFFGLNSSRRSKNQLQAKKFFSENFQKHLEKIHSSFSMRNFSKCFSGHFSKKIFLPTTNFQTFQMSLSQKKFFGKFCFEKNMLGGASRATFQVFFQHQYSQSFLKMKLKITGIFVASIGC